MACRSTAMSPDSLIEEVRRGLARLESPGDPNRWTDDLAREFSGHTVVNWTDFSYGNCHSYEIMLAAGQYARPGSKAEELELLRRLGGSRKLVWLKMSVVLPRYVACLLSRSADVNGEIVDTEIDRPAGDEAELLGRAWRFAESRGFQAIGAEELRQVVPGVQLELAPAGKATVYNCLFEDEDAPA